MAQSQQPNRKCQLCGKTCYGRVCIECFKKGKYSRESHYRKRRIKRHVRNEEDT